MHARLAVRARADATVTLGAAVTFPDGPLHLTYHTRTGALLRIDGVVRGAFDVQHATIALPPQPGRHEVTLEVERSSVPTSGLPAGDGVRWRWMLAHAAQRPAQVLTVEPAPADGAGETIDVPLVGHAHLDVAWLWTYDATRRKALRTFATALRQVETTPYVFAQSQPQLYAWVAAADRALFERIRARLGGGWDAGVATMWVEPDCHAPSGESLLRQFAHGIRWMRDELGVEPTVAWLPDSFGFPGSFPTLAAHAGVFRFATTKLQWNEVTRWPYPQFRWIGDDGATLTAAVVDAYEGGVGEQRLAKARTRHEPLVVGYGDGGGGATDEQLAQVGPGSHGWTRLEDWFAGVSARPLPDYRGELYLETHRGTYTTHHDVKQRNAACERGLARAEELAAWCVAVRAPETVRRALADDLRTAWRIVLRGQFHDVLPGTSITPVYADVHADYDHVEAILERVAAAARSILPRSDVRPSVSAPVRPHADGDGWIVENDFVRARLRADGTVDELSARDGANVVSVANGIVAFVDKPKRWDAWNVDAGYERRPVRVRPNDARLEDDALRVQLAVGKRSRATMRVALHEDEPWLRVELAVAWHEDHVLLRAEHRVALPAQTVRFGEPHGTRVRTAYPTTDAERARFEVPGQRWAHVAAGERGLAVFTSDLYGWSALGLKNGGVRLGTSLLRSPRWPDPNADRGERRLSYALVPTAGATISALEHGWLAYAEEERVRLFTCEDDAVLVVATYPSDDGGGVVVRVRELDGANRAVALRCGGRMREAQPIDAVERPIAGDASIVDEELRFALGAFALRSFLVRF
ncbi:MAG TPA: glycoside hydrolase family 38 C-terminal domain-containing protein [Candidatus Sulfotelmatobacter sp.]|nr:glycoside hydrolase family 38 C-terminal domain-containing protein [Candidatus Sulfotelmatobacter sp.]